VTRCSSIAAGAIAAVLLFPALSHATLGGKPTLAVSNTARQSLLRSAAQPAASNPLWSLHSARSDDGVTVHEYASLDGIVFAVIWSGPVRPDMAALLGSYFPNVASAARTARRRSARRAQRRVADRIDRTSRTVHRQGVAAAARAGASRHGRSGVRPTM
jgi:hypothetical protein